MCRSWRSTGAVILATKRGIVELPGAGPVLGYTAAFQSMEGRSTGMLTPLRGRWCQVLFACAVCGLLAACSPQEPSGKTAQAPAAVPADPVAARAQVAVDNAMAGWVASGLRVGKGDEVAIFADGKLAAEGLVLEPKFLLWYRIGNDGEAANLVANHDTFVAPAAGEIFVTVRPPGVYWSDRRGSYPAGFTDAPPVPVDFDIELVRFNGTAANGLPALAGAGSSAAKAALESRAARKRLPVGFESLWYLGRGNVWADGASDGRPGITAETDDDTDIVKKVLDIPLTPNTEIAFDWRYDAVPALGPETEQQFHDYVSIALEFDNGQDLTWLRASHVAAGVHFHCPLVWWDSRETHYVLQGAEAPLGEWSTHKRNVLADYATAVGGDAPARIVGVWFIANSLFGRQRSAASFAEVAIIDGEQRVNVF
jgi:hypothetical protein